MKHYDGKIQNLNPVKGEIKPKKVIGQVSIVNRLENFRTYVRNLNALSGTATKRPAPVVTAIKRIDARYALFRTLAKIFDRFTARASASPTRDLNADAVVKSGKRVAPGASEVERVTVDRKIVASSLVRAVSRALAPLVYIGEILTSHVLKLSTALGVTARFSEVLRVKRVSSAKTATGSILRSRNNRFTADREATGSSAQTKGVSAKRAVVEDNMTTPIAADTVSGNVSGGQKDITFASVILAWAVRFFNWDKKVLYETLVNYGSNCPDPVANGYIGELTRESDAKYHYGSLIGWSQTLDGALDPNALNNITRSRDLYPVFERELRSYTISFYDGEKLIHTQDVRYGDLPEEYTPTKDGFQFIGWTPEIVPVTGPAAYGAIWLADCLASGTCGNSATWILSKAGELIVSGTGAMSDYAAYTDQPWYAYASEIKKITVEYGITHIGSQSFRATNVTDITIPESVTSLGKSAFYGNTLLTSVKIPGSITSMDVYALGGCTNLTRVELQTGLTLIGGYMFKDCKNLTAITLPETITYIGNYAFHASGLKTIRIPKSVTVVGPYAFINSSLSTASWDLASGAEWYKCSSETATSGTKFYPRQLTDVGLASELKRTSSAGLGAYWLKVI